MVLLLCVSYILGVTQFTICPTSPQCVSVPVTYQCSVDTSGTPDSLRWRVLDTSGGPLGASIFGSGSSPGNMDSIATQFNTSVTSNTGSSIVSDITFIPTMSINNYTVQCAAVAVSVDNFTPVTRTCPIMVEGKCC